MTACGCPYVHTIWSADELTQTGSFPSGAYPLAGAWSADGTTFVAGLDSAYAGRGLPPPGREPAGAVGGLRRHDLAPPGPGLAASADGRRAWAVASSSAGLVLHVLDLPRADAPTLTVAASPVGLYPGEPVTVPGRLAAVTGAPLAGELLQVSHVATGAAPVPLPSVTTAADGTFSLSDLPPGSGSYVYTVSRKADGARGDRAGVAHGTDPAA